MSHLWHDLVLVISPFIVRLLVSHSALLAALAARGLSGRNVARMLVQEADELLGLQLACTAWYPQLPSIVGNKGMYPCMALDRCNTRAIRLSKIKFEG